LHDGEIIERTLEHIRSQQNGGSADPTSQRQQGDLGGAQSVADADSQPGTKPDERPSDGSDHAQSGSESLDDLQPGGTSDDGSDPGTDPATMDAQTPNQQGQTSPEGSGQGSEDRNQGAGTQRDGEPSPGGEPQGPAQTQPESSQSDSIGGPPEQGGLGQDGESGAGQDTQDESGSPASMQENADRPKQGDAGENQQQPSGEPQSPSQSEHQSDSQGEGQGEHSGGGEKGGGQGSRRPGNDSSGSQNPADQGSGTAQQSGSGDSSSQPGNKQLADHTTGAPSSQKGDGSSTEPVPDGLGPSGPSDSSSETQTAERPAGQPTASDSEKPGQGRPTGGGRPGEADSMHSDTAGDAQDGDEPNLDYAKRTTDLVLEYLRDQQQKPDPELLDRLRWTEDDLRQFLSRWDDLQRAAANDPRGQQDFSDAVRSLGLQPDQQTSRRISAPTDPVQGLREAGATSSPPSKYLEQFNAYKKGTARVDE
jgi:hypothetical protein